MTQFFYLNVLSNNFLGNFLKSSVKVKSREEEMAQSRNGSRKSREFKIFGPFLLKFFLKKSLRIY